MPFTAEWWPARYLMAPLKEYFNRPILCLAGIKIHKGGIQRKTMACHLMAAEWKKGRCFMLLSFSNTQVFWQTAQSGGVRVCMRMCVCLCLSSHLYYPPLHCPWSLKRTASSKNRHIKTQGVCKVVRNALWGAGDFCVAQGPVEKKGREMAGVLHCQSQGYKGKGLSQELTFPWPFTCVYLSHFVATVYSSY